MEIKINKYLVCDISSQIVGWSLWYEHAEVWTILPCICRAAWIINTQIMKCIMIYLSSSWYSLSNTLKIASDEEEKSDT